MIDADSLKSQVDLRLFVSGDLTEPISKSGSVWMFRCPFHKDDTASLGVWNDHWHCFGACGENSNHGDIFTYIERRTGVSFKEAIEMVANKIGLPAYSQPPTEKKPSRIITYEDAERYHFNVGVVHPYLESRSIPDSIIESRFLGADTYKQRRTYVDLQQKRWTFETNRVALPYIRFGSEVYSLNFRRDDFAAYEYLKRMDKYHDCNVLECMRADIARKRGDPVESVSDKKVFEHCFGMRFYRPNTRVTAYGVDRIIRREGEKLIYPRHASAVIVEGEIDQLSAESEGFLCVSLKHVKNGNVNVQRLFQNIRVVFVAADPDEAGEVYANMMLGAFGSDYTKVRKMILPDKRDFNELHRAGELASFLTSRPYYVERIM